MSEYQTTDLLFMQMALAAAQKAQRLAEVPIGAIAVVNNEPLSIGFNCPISRNDPTAHAEIIALREAARLLNNYRLPEVTLYVTLEPCAMCIGALLHARIKRLIFGAKDPKAGAVVSLFNLLDEPRLNHKLPYHFGVLAPECGALLTDFFKSKR